jgi:hypothetical protein
MGGIGADVLWSETWVNLVIEEINQRGERAHRDASLLVFKLEAYCIGMLNSCCIEGLLNAKEVSSHIMAVASSHEYSAEDGAPLKVERGAPSRFPSHFFYRPDT